MVILPYHWLIAGLVLDLVGVLLLGADLIRLHRSLRTRAAKTREFYDQLEETYGGVESWMRDVAEKYTGWKEPPRSSADPAELHNLGNTIEVVKEVAEGVYSVASRLARINEVLDASARRDESLSASSMLVSYIGLAFLTVGFILQIIGAYSASAWDAERPQRQYSLRL